jgi:hypothetical protein
MKVTDCKDYKREFPESFKWEMIDSYKLSAVAKNIAEAIKFDLSGKRDNVPGLRFALRIIAKEADI